MCPFHFRAVDVGSRGPSIVDSSELMLMRMGR